MFRLSRSKQARQPKPRRGKSSARRTVVGLNARKLRQMRCVELAGTYRLAVTACREITDFLAAGRVPLDASLKALEMAQAEVQDRLSDESLTWVDSQRPWHGGDRDRGDDD